MVRGEVLLQGDFHGLVHELVDVNGGEERMGHDLIEVSIGTKSGLLVLVQKSHNYVNKLFGVVDLVLVLVGENNLRLLNFQEQELTFSVVERSDTDKHLINQNSYSPPVDREVVTLMSDHFGSQVLRSSTESLA